MPRSKKNRVGTLLLFSASFASESDANQGEGERAQGRGGEQDQRGSGQLQIHLRAAVRQHADKRLQGAPVPAGG